MQRTVGRMARGREALLALAMLGLIGCGPYEGEGDETCDKARPLPANVGVKDELNFRRGDGGDCKQIKYFKDARAKVEYKVGTAFSKHNLKGAITVYDDSARVLDQKSVDPSVPVYTLEFDVQANKSYYVDFKVTEGNHGYEALVQYTVRDPCAACTEDQKCVAGKCKDIERPKTCDPPCDEEEGLICEDTKCIKACQPECKKGFQCNITERQCEKVTKECKPKCKKDEYCDGLKGICRVKKPAGCAGGCPAGQICQSGKCAPLAGPKCPDCPAGQHCDASTGYKCAGTGAVAIPTTGPITAGVVSTVRQPQGTIVYVDKGERHGVKAGGRGKMCGKFDFVVIKPYPTRSQGKTSASIEDLAACKSVVINR